MRLRPEIDEEIELFRIGAPAGDLQKGIPEGSFYTCSGNGFIQDPEEAGLIRHSADVIDKTFAKGILGYGRSAFIEIVAILGQAPGAFQMYQVAEHTAGGFRTVFKYDAIGLLRRQSVDLLHPDAGHFPQRAGVAAQMYIIRLIHNATHETGDKSAALFHKRFQGLSYPIPDHIQKGRDYDGIPAEIPIGRNHIHGDVPLIKIIIVGMDLIHIFQIFMRPAGVFHSPVVFPIEEDSHLSLVHSWENAGKTLELFPKLGRFPENTGVFRSRVLNHCTMKFFTGPHRTPELEKLNGVGAMGDGLVALSTHLPRSLQRIIGLPILLAGRLLHEHKGLSLEAAHQIVTHGSQAP